MSQKDKEGHEGRVRACVRCGATVALRALLQGAACVGGLPQLRRPSRRHAQMVCVCLYVAAAAAGAHRWSETWAACRSPRSKHDTRDEVLKRGGAMG